MLTHRRRAMTDPEADSLDASDLPDLRPGDAAPLHHRIKEVFREQINSGVWKRDSLLPSEEAICRRYNVSRGTVRRAIEHLVQEGLVCRQQGRGTFVRRPTLQGSILASYSQYIVDGIRHDAGAVVLRCDRRVPAADIREILELDEHDEVYVLERVRFVGSDPLSLQTSYLPAAICPGLESKDLRNLHLYDVLRQEFDLWFLRAEEYVEPALASKRVAKILGIGVGAPIFSVERRSYTFGGKLGEFRRASMRGDRFKYRIDLR